MTNQGEIIAKYVFLAIINDQPGIKEADLMNLCCESMYMDYFSFTSIKAEMQAKELAAKSMRKAEASKDLAGHTIARWDLTPSGHKVLEDLVPTIPDAVHNYLYQLSKSKQIKKNEAVYKIDRNSFGDYVVILQLIEMNKIIVELKFPFNSPEAAEAVGKKWQKNYAVIYPQIVGPFMN